MGRALFSFYRERGFAFPGEKGDAPETIIAHDLTHVLTGYSTDLESEACVTSFPAGYRREGPFSGLLFVSLNMQKRRSDDSARSGASHMFGEPGMAARIVSAWKLGTLVKVDLVTEWDYWPEMQRPGRGPRLARRSSKRVSFRPGPSVVEEIERLVDVERDLKQKRVHLLMPQGHPNLMK